MDTNDYLKKFKEEGNFSFIQTGKSEAYKTALDIRKFEIQMFWTRANYFFLFVSASFAAYGVVLAWKPSEIGISIQTRQLLLIAISGISLIVSLAWYLANKGGKFWQENWEYHTDLLEENEIGSLYRTVLSKSGNGLELIQKIENETDFCKKKELQIKAFTLPLLSVLNLSSSYPYSPTKVNLILSAFTTVLSVLIFSSSSLKFIAPSWVDSYFKSSSDSLTPAGIAIVVLVITFAFLMIFSCRSSTKDTTLSIYASFRDTKIKKDITPNSTTSAAS